MDILGIAERYRLLCLAALMPISEAERILGVQKGIDLDDLKKIYKKKVISLHPDKNPGRDTTSEMAMLNVAFGRLRDDPNWFKVTPTTGPSPRAQTSDQFEDLIWVPGLTRISQLSRERPTKITCGRFLVVCMPPGYVGGLRFRIGVLTRGELPHLNSKWWSNFGYLFQLSGMEILNAEVGEATLKEILDSLLWPEADFSAPRPAPRPRPAPPRPAPPRPASPRSRTQNAGSILNNLSFKDTSQGLFERFTIGKYIFALRTKELSSFSTRSAHVAADFNRFDLCIYTIIAGVEKIIKAKSPMFSGMPNANRFSDSNVGHDLTLEEVKEIITYFGTK